MCFSSITDIRDGLYPSLRQTLSMLQEATAENKFKNSTQVLKVIADTLNTDIDEIYDALINITAPRSFFPLIDGLGNFGFPPAHHNFSEIRLSDFFNLITNAKQIADFTQPLYVPFPYALVNGAAGITKIPTHNLNNVIDATIALIQNPDLKTKDLMQFIKGPTLLIGGIVENPEELLNIYEKGSGTVKMVITPESLSEYSASYAENFVDLVKSFCNWYGLKFRKLFLRKAFKIEINYNAFVNNGKESKLMSLKEMLQEFIQHYKSCNQALTDGELCAALSEYKILS